MDLPHLGIIKHIGYTYLSQIAQHKYYSIIIKSSAKWKAGKKEDPVIRRALRQLREDRGSDRGPDEENRQSYR